jgi:hypothetical protein
MSVTPSSPVVGVFTDRSMAEQAVGALYNAGFEHEQIRYSVPGNSGSFFEGLKSLFTGTSPNGDDLANDLTSMGLSDEEARYYSNEVRNRNIILAVQARGREQEALSVLHQYRAYNSHDVFNQATNYAQQSSDSTQQDNYGTSQPQNNAQNWQTQPQFGTSAEPPFDDREQDIITPEHETDYQAPQTNVTTPEQEAESQNALSVATGEKAEDWTAQSDVVAPEASLANQAPQASVVAPDYATEDRTAQSDMSAPDRDLEAQSPQANAAVTSEQIDEFQQLQEQLRAAQQQLQEAKTQLQAAKERETQLWAAREREQQFQTMKQQLQEVQSELEATLAELRETQARLAQYQ